MIFRLGDEVVTKRTKEKGVVTDVRPDDRFDVWVKHAKGSAVPYRSVELEPLPKPNHDKSWPHPFSGERL